MDKIVLYINYRKGMMNNMAKVFYDKEKDIIAFHPGYYIQDMIEEDDVKEILIKGLGEKTLNDLIAGDIDVDRELAKNLEICTGVSKLTWISLQDTYDEKIKHRKKTIEDTFVEEYKASTKDMLIIMTLLAICVCPLLFLPLIIALIIAPIYLNAEPANKIIYYMVLFFILPLLIMAARRLKDIFINTIKFMIGKLS